MGRRSSLECQIDIISALEHQKRPQKLTHLTYRTNLNASRLKRYLRHLKRDGLIKEFRDSRGGKFYQITHQGKLALDYYRQFRDMMPKRRPKENPDV